MERQDQKYYYNAQLKTHVVVNEPKASEYRTVISGGYAFQVVNDRPQDADAKLKTHVVVNEPELSNYKTVISGGYAFQVVNDQLQDKNAKQQQYQTLNKQRHQQHFRTFDEYKNKQEDEALKHKEANRQREAKLKTLDKTKNLQKALETIDAHQESSSLKDVKKTLKAAIQINSYQPEFYAALNIKCNANKEELAKGFREVSRFLHSDKNKISKIKSILFPDIADPEAQNLLDNLQKEVDTAFTTLNGIKDILSYRIDKQSAIAKEKECIKNCVTKDNACTQGCHTDFTHTMEQANLIGARECGEENLYNKDLF